MIDFTNIPNYAEAARAWLYRVHQDIFRQCDSWQAYTENVVQLEQLIDALEQGALPDVQRAHLFAAIGKYQLYAADIAYVLGVQHGIAAQKAFAGDEIMEMLKHCAK